MRPYFMMSFLLVSIVALADDNCDVGIGGRVTRMAGANTVRMMNEWVTIDVHASYYDVKAEFALHNDGKATTLQLGFPESGYGDGIVAQYSVAQSSFLNFAAWVDDSRVTATRLCSYAQGGDRYEAYWVSQVPFAAKQTRYARFEYRSPYDDSSDSKQVFYNFYGSTWTGKVDSSDLIVKIDEPGLTVASANIFMNRKDNRLSQHWFGADADDDFILTSWFIPPGELIQQSEQMTHKWVFTIPGTISVKNTSQSQATSALLRDGVACIPIRAIETYYEGRAERYNRMNWPRVSWDDTTKEASLIVGHKTLTFTEGSKILKVDDREVPLTVTPFRYPLNGPNKQLYVPLRPIVDAIGGDVNAELYSVGNVQAGIFSYMLKDYWDVK